MTHWLVRCAEAHDSRGAPVSAHPRLLPSAYMLAELVCDAAARFPPAAIEVLPLCLSPQAAAAAAAALLPVSRPQRSKFPATLLPVEAGSAAGTPPRLYAIAAPTAAAAGSSETNGLLRLRVRAVSGSAAFSAAAAGGAGSAAPPVAGATGACPAVSSASASPAAAPAAAPASAIDFAFGDPVRKLPGGPTGTIASASVVLYQLRYEDGSEACVAHEFTRRQTGVMAFPEVSYATISPGARVQALWPHHWEGGGRTGFEDATVLAAGGGFQIRYDDGTVGFALAAGVKPARAGISSGTVQLEVGMKVQARWTTALPHFSGSWPDWYPGRIEDVIPALYHVRFESDGRRNCERAVVFDSVKAKPAATAGGAGAGAAGASDGEHSTGGAVGSGFWPVGATVDALWDEGSSTAFPGYYNATVLGVEHGYRVKFREASAAFTPVSALARLA